ncbi:MAG: HemK family protein methyltransferase [Dehalococcoidia bacterium]|nr:HemK family protein methyltransferase [Dehalococcoidia bacterium]
MPDAITLRSAIAAARDRLRAAGIDDAALEAEVLLRHALGLSRSQLFMRLEGPIDPVAAARYEAVLARRLAHEPTAYITGHREFYGLDFAVTTDTLIPRPETETLVDAALDIIRRRPPHARYRLDHWPEPSYEETFATPQRPIPEQPALPGAGVTIADIGTGSGAIAVSLARALPGVRLIAIDLSAAALEVASANARRHGVDSRIDFRQGDLLSPLDTRVDVIIANLPYVNTPDYLTLDPEVRDQEPQSALDGGPDGLDLIRRLIAAAPSRLNPQSSLLLEFGASQSEALTALAHAVFPNSAITIRPDLAGHPRVLIVSL